MRVSIYGLGHVGSVNAAYLAQEDRRPYRSREGFPGQRRHRASFESGLEEALSAGIVFNRPLASMDPIPAVGQSDASLLCVDAPGNASRDIGHVEL